MTVTKGLEDLIFINKIEELLRIELKGKDIELGNAVKTTDNYGWPYYKYKISDIEIGISKDNVSVEAGKILRTFTLFDEKDTERYVRDISIFIEYYLKNPHIRKKSILWNIMWFLLFILMLVIIYHSWKQLSPLYSFLIIGLTLVPLINIYQTKKNKN